MKAFHGRDRPVVNTSPPSELHGSEHVWTMSPITAPSQERRGFARLEIMLSPQR